MLEQVMQAITDFEIVQTNLREFGAADTEPDAEFQILLKRAVLDLPETLPLTPIKWQLFRMKNNRRAAAALNEAAGDVTKLIHNCRKHCNAVEFAKVVNYIKGYCWRLTWD
jgi:hypothetical protein